MQTLLQLFVMHSACGNKFCLTIISLILTMCTGFIMAPLPLRAALKGKGDIPDLNQSFSV